MPDSTSPDTIPGVAGSEVSDAFALLGDETRLAILLALWLEYEPHSEEPASYSRIYDRVDYDDRGNFSYHLGKLVGQFVDKKPDQGGYKLLDPGLKLVRALIAGIWRQDETLNPTEIDQRCQLCGAPTAVGYADRQVYWKCTSCSGIVPEGSEKEGFLGGVAFEPAGMFDRTPEEIKASSRVAILHHEGSMFDGLCPTCSGPVEGWLDPCLKHESEGACQHCGYRFSTRARFQCRVCKDHTTISPMSLALLHPAVVTFYENHGVSTRFTADDFGSGKRIESLLEGHRMDIIETDPPKVAVTVSYEGDEVHLIFDESVDVVDVRG